MELRLEEMASSPFPVWAKMESSFPVDAEEMQVGDGVESEAPKSAGQVNEAWLNAASAVEARRT